VFVAKGKGGMFSSGDVRVAVSGAGNNGVFRVGAMEAALKANFSAQAIASVSVPAAGLMSDMHGQADYRAALIGTMAQKAVASA
jgi:carbon-monoxide dehydrogenase medium subunit